MGKKTTNPGAASVQLSPLSMPQLSGSKDCFSPKSRMQQRRIFKWESRTETEESEEWDHLHVCCASRKQACAESKVHDHCANRN